MTVLWLNADICTALLGVVGVHVHSRMEILGLKTVNLTGVKDVVFSYSPLKNFFLEEGKIY